MLPADDVRAIAGLLARGAPQAQIRAAARAARTRVQPGAPGQPAVNAPGLDGEPVPGLRHEDPGTVLIFPRQGQASHASRTSCFGRARFTGEPDPGVAAHAIDKVTRYLRGCPQVSGVVIAGADPMLMGAAALRCYLEPLLDPALEHIDSVGFATWSLGYWPQRFAGDPDADDTLRLFEQVAAAGKTLAVTAWFCHPRELDQPAAAAAAGRIRAAGAVIRTQAPLVKTVNDDPRAWAAMWRAQLRLGLIPYEMVVARDTGPRGYFAVPLAAGVQIFHAGFASVSGLCRTVRGPSMQTAPGRVCADGVTQISGEKVFVLHMIQARDPSLAGGGSSPGSTRAPCGCLTSSRRSHPGSRSNRPPRARPGCGLRNRYRPPDSSTGWRRTFRGRAALLCAAVSAMAGQPARLRREVPARGIASVGLAGRTRVSASAREGIAKAGNCARKGPQ